jgi:hypothetical protein
VKRCKIAGGNLKRKRRLICYRIGDVFPRFRKILFSGFNSAQYSEGATLRAACSSDPPSLREFTAGRAHSRPASCVRCRRETERLVETTETPWSGRHSAVPLHGAGGGRGEENIQQEGATPYVCLGHVRNACVRRAYIAEGKPKVTVLTELFPNSNGGA